VIIEYDLVIYQTPQGKRPFEQWIEKQKDNQAVAAIKLRLRCVTLGNLGDSKSVGNGVYELRIDFGPGYRVYYGKVGQKVILLLCVGSKRTQEKDIKLAKEYLNEFQERCY
jgi:putative addiction module killer protein